jgi:hypothetical protein
VKTVKGIKFSYHSTPHTRELLSTFKLMVNEAIRICLSENVKGRLKLRNRIYREFQERYGVMSCLPYSVAEVAWSIVKKYKRWHRTPSAKRLMYKMDSANFSLNYSILSLPFRKGERVSVPLRYGEYQRSFLMDKTLMRGSVTVTESSIIIAYSKESCVKEPSKKVGYDLNERSIVGSDGSRHDLSEVARLHTLYGVRRSKFSESHASDRRLRRLKGIRFAHQKGNGEGKARRRRIAMWPFRQLQSYIDYKARWAGVPVEYVSPSYTSKKCHVCGAINRNLKLTERSWLCPCGAKLDRDLNAAINIERRGKIRCLGEVRPGARDTDEVVKGNPEGRRQQAILRAEAPKPNLGEGALDWTEPFHQGEAASLS